MNLKRLELIDFFNRWSVGGGVISSRWCYSILVDFGDNGTADFLDFLLLVLELFLVGQTVAVEPLDGFVASFLDRVAILLRQFVFC